ncbi:MAG: L-2-hydroxyglutarate oxidase [Desulfobacterales bacterium]|nr:L-2-hydroxyglutarate oxidase [Desulfobacterales bacterium]
MKKYDLVLIGGGIVGVSTAWQMKQRYPDAAILLVEKEFSLARHQTGHNSGVIHAGVYYQPGSLKADFCRRGRRQTIDFCKQYGLSFEQCGKLLVATDAAEYQRMEALEARCAKNRIDTHLLTGAELRRREPGIVGLGALFVPATGITDYKTITSQMADLFRAMGGEIRFGAEIKALREEKNAVRVCLGTDAVAARYVFACGGLMADRLAKMMDIPIDFQIVPFRGEYYQLPAGHNRLIRHLIYPIPDPELPFLGVHLTKMIDGSVTVGPNAVMGWKREGYGRFNLSLEDSLQMLGFPGFWKVARSNLKSGISEYLDSIYKPGYLKRVTKYCPGLTVADLHPFPAGIRAQAVMGDGSLVHDFLFAESPRSLHVCNAPSPAATSAMPIGAYLCDRMTAKFDL